MMKSIELKRVEGIVIHTLDYQEYDKILRVFTADFGVLQFIMKGANRPKKRHLCCSSPLTHAIFCYKPSDKELQLCKEITVINHWLKIRCQLPVLEAACAMLQAIKKSQLLNKPSPQLYALLKMYLSKLFDMKDPLSLSCSFYLKLLRHDGLIHLCPHCISCGQSPKKIFINKGEIFCERHAKDGAFCLEENEAPLVFQLAHCKQFSEINSISINKTIQESIEHIFNDCLCQ